MLVMSPELVLTLKKAPDGNSPIIGYRNIVTRGNVIASSEEPLHPSVNLADPTTHRRWRAADLGEQLIVVEAAQAHDLDYVGIAGHNLATAVASIAIEVLIGEAWLTVAGPVVPGNNSPIIFRFAPVFASRIRIRIGEAVGLVEIATLSIGQLLVLPRRIYVNHTPLKLGRQYDVVTSQSESGNFLGRVVVGESRVSQAEFQNLPPDWYRQHMDPFVLHAVTRPFFFAWRPSSYPKESGYAWLTGAPMPVNQRSNGMMQVALQMRGIA